MARQSTLTKGIKRKTASKGPYKVGAWDSFGFQKAVTKIKQPMGGKKSQLAEAWEVEFIFAARRVRGAQGLQWEYAVKWVGWPWKHVTWEPQKSFLAEVVYKSLTGDYTFITNSRGQPAYLPHSPPAKDVPAISAFERLLKNENEDFATLPMKEHRDDYKIVLSLRTVYLLWKQSRQHQSKEELLVAIDLMEEELDEVFWPANKRDLGSESEDEAMEALIESDNEGEQDALGSPEPMQAPEPPRRNPMPETRPPAPPAMDPIQSIEPKTPVRKRQTAPRRRVRPPAKSIRSDSEDANTPKRHRPERPPTPPIEEENALEDAIPTKNRLARGHEQISPQMPYSAERNSSLLTATNKRRGLVSVNRDGRVQSVQTWQTATPSKPPIQKAAPQTGSPVARHYVNWCEPDVNLSINLSEGSPQPQPRATKSNIDPATFQITGRRAAEPTRITIEETDESLRSIEDPLAPASPVFSSVRRVVSETPSQILPSSQPVFSNSFLRLRTGDKVPLRFSVIWADPVAATLAWKLGTGPSYPPVFIESENARRIENRDFERFLRNDNWRVVSCVKAERLRSGVKEVEHIQLFRQLTEELIHAFMFTPVMNAENHGLIVFAARNGDLQEAFKSTVGGLHPKVRMESYKGSLLVAHLAR